MKPTRSLKAIRVKVAAPPVSGIDEVPSAYESATIMKRAPMTSSTQGVSPSACRAMIPRAK
jgi:hypothetical protein